MSEHTVAIGKALEESIRESVEGRDMAVAFSGGLDSGIVAALTKRYAGSVTLYTVGYGDSYDMRMAEGMASDLGMELVRLPITEENLIESLKEMISVTGTSSPLTVAFETPLFYVCRDCREDLIIGGQGSDEIFAGYSKYVGLPDAELKAMMAEDLEKLKGPTLAHEGKVAAHFGRTILYPFMDPRVTGAVSAVGTDVLRPVGKDGRKTVLKEVATEMGYPFIADKQKKAAQYGSGMMDAVRRICRSKGMTFTELVEELRPGL